MKAEEVERSGLSGADLVAKGIRDLLQGTISAEALLVLVASPKHESLGLEILVLTEAPTPYEHALYSKLEDLHGAGAHSQYNSLIGRVVGFSRALEREFGARKRSAG